MISPFRPINEDQRLEALRRLRILDTLPEERFDRITLKALQLLKTPYAMLGFVDANRIWYKSRQGFPESEIPRDFSFCGYSILRSEVFHIPDAMEDARFSDNPMVVNSPGLRMYAGYPLFSDDNHPIGVLSVADTKPRFLTKEEIKTLMVLGNWAEEEIKTVQASISGDRVYLSERNRELEQEKERLALAVRLLRRMAFVDDLTDIPNRRYFDQAFESSFRTARSEASPLTLLMIDIDFFKNYNDIHGHGAGDHTLQVVARRIQQSLRNQEDFAARYGGDEFAVIAPKTDEKGGLELARRIFGRFLQETQLFSPAPERLITISIGVATRIPQAGEKEDVLFQLADQALFKAKRLGRHCVVSASGAKWEASGPGVSGSRKDRLPG